MVARADASRIPGLDPAVAGPLDVQAVFAHRDKMSSYWKDEDQVDWLNSVGVDLIRGHGRLTGPKQVSSSQRHLREELFALHWPAR